MVIYKEFNFLLSHWSLNQLKVCKINILSIFPYNFLTILKATLHNIQFTTTAVMHRNIRNIISSSCLRFFRHTCCCFCHYFQHFRTFTYLLMYYVPPPVSIHTHTHAYTFKARQSACSTPLTMPHLVASITFASSIFSYPLNKQNLQIKCKKAHMLVKQVAMHCLCNLHHKTRSLAEDATTWNISGNWRALSKRNIKILFFILYILKRLYIWSF